MRRSPSFTNNVFAHLHLSLVVLRRAAPLAKSQKTGGNPCNFFLSGGQLSPQQPHTWPIPILSTNIQHSNLFSAQHQPSLFYIYFLSHRPTPTCPHISISTQILLPKLICTTHCIISPHLNSDPTLIRHNKICLHPSTKPHTRAFWITLLETQLLFFQNLPYSPIKVQTTHHVITVNTVELVVSRDSISRVAGSIPIASKIIFGRPVLEP